jgi:hypothetical protein
MSAANNAEGGKVVSFFIELCSLECLKHFIAG